MAGAWVRGAAGAALWVFLAVPAVRHLLESSMVGHMLGELPALAVAGWLAAGFVPGRARRALAAFDPHGVAAVLTAAFTITTWSLPRQLDAAITSPASGLTRLLLFPPLAGAALALGWERMTGLGRAFVAANALSMAGAMGWLYVAAPVRLCTSYRFDQQQVVGVSLLAATGLLCAGLVAAAFVGRVPPA